MEHKEDSKEYRKTFTLSLRFSTEQILASECFSFEIKYREEKNRFTIFSHVKEVKVFKKSTWRIEATLINTTFSLFLLNDFQFLL